MRHLFITVFALFLALTSASAQVSFGIEIQPNGRAIPTGDQAVVSVRIASEQRVNDRPTLTIEGGDLDVQRGGTRQSAFMFGKSSRHDITYTFGVRGKPGTYTIRANVRDQAGENYQSDPVTLRIRDRTAAEKANDPELMIQFSKTSAFEGEPIEAQVLLVEKKGSRYSHEPTNRPSIEGDGMQITFDQEAYHGPEINGNKTYAFKARIVPLRPGALSLTASFKPDVAIPGATRRMRMNRFDLTTERQTLNIKPLPTVGRPSDFTGAVGTFKLTIGADPLALEPGEPIGLRLSISGKGNFDSLTAPKPSEREGWQFYEASALEIQPGDDGGPSKLEFEQNIVPQVAKSQIPSFKLSVFDPEKKAYVNLITAPIPIQMNGRSSPAAPPSSITPNTASESPPTRDRPTAGLNDILLASGTTSPRWASVTQPAWRRSGFWWLQGGLAVALIGAGFAARTVAARRTRPDRPPEFRDLLRAAENAPADSPTFYAAAKACLDSWSEAKPGNEEELPAPLAPVSERHDFFQFAGKTDSTSEPVPADQRREILDSLRALGL